MPSVESSVSDRGKSHTVSDLKGDFSKLKGIERIMDKGTDVFEACVYKYNGQW